MKNVVLFVATVALYFSSWFVWFLFYYSSEPSFETCIIVASSLLLLCVPFNIGGNIFTVLGNAVSEKSIFSVLSLYQKANKNAFSLVSLYQKADGSTVSVFGFLGYQDAGDDAFMFSGISIYQRSNIETVLFVGFSLYQEGSGDIIHAVGISLYQRAKGSVWVIVGVSGYQRSDNEDLMCIGLSLYQQVGDRVRAFAAFSKLT